MADWITRAATLLSDHFSIEEAYVIQLESRPAPERFAGGAKNGKNISARHRCLICNLNRVRQGHGFVYSSGSTGCLGGKRYTGFPRTLRPNFEYFLSCGLPGKMEGERYKESPELARVFFLPIAGRK